jgi:hypothetical protein
MSRLHAVGWDHVIIITPILRSLPMNPGEIDFPTTSPLIAGITLLLHQFASASSKQDISG